MIWRALCDQARDRQAVEQSAGNGPHDVMMGFRDAFRTFLVVGLFGMSTVEDASALSCSISPITASYGTVDILAGTAVDITGSFTVSCTGGSANQSIRLCLEMGAGITSVGPSNERVLRSASDYMDHEFYFDSSRTQLWGSSGAVVTAYPTASPADTQQDVTLSAGGTGTFNYTVYARISAGQQTKTPGTYSWTGSSPAVTYRSTSGASSCPTSSSGSAASSGSTFSATVNADCKISTTTMDFGSTASAIAANIDSTATISAQCTNTIPYSVGLSSGVNASGSQNRMRLGATANYVNYNLYTDSARSQAWTTTTSTTSCTSGVNTCSLGTGTGSSQNIIVYGRVPAQTAPAAGTFTDTVVVTFTF